MNHELIALAAALTLSRSIAVTTRELSFFVPPGSSPGVPLRAEKLRSVVRQCRDDSGHFWGTFGDTDECPPKLTSIIARLDISEKRLRDVSCANELVEVRDDLKKTMLDLTDFLNESISTD